MAETTGTYVYDQTWKEERERLAGMERLWDPGTQAIIASLGIGPGWKCLEVGAGAGSIAEWLADRVGPDGTVLATDVSIRYLSAVERPNLAVREHDVLRDPLPEDRFDLVHARLVVEHLGRAALERMVPALRPGGWLVLEDYSFASSGVVPPTQLFERVTAAVIEFMSRAGFEAVGLQDVDADARARVSRGGTPGTAFIRLSLEALRGGIVEAGLLTDEEVEAGLAAAGDPANVFISPLMVAGWGRKPPP
jgi:SAM-dependent methyltransferase